MSILVTGGAGYIGSHTCVELLNQGYDVVIVDNFYNCKPSSLTRIRALVQKPFSFYNCDIRDKDGLQKIFDNEKIKQIKRKKDGDRLIVIFINCLAIASANACCVIPLFFLNCFNFSLKFIFIINTPIYFYENIIKQ